MPAWGPTAAPRSHFDSDRVWLTRRGAVSPRRVHDRPRDPRRRLDLPIRTTAGVRTPTGDTLTCTEYGLEAYGADWATKPRPFSTPHTNTYLSCTLTFFTLALLGGGLQALGRMCFFCGGLWERGVHHHQPTRLPFHRSWGGGAEKSFIEPHGAAVTTTRPSRPGSGNGFILSFF